MLRSLKELEGYSVQATDGEIGTVKDLLVDDEHWGIRYLVVKTGGFFNGHAVLISPISFRKIDETKREFHLSLTMEKVRDSPSIDLDKPVSRQHEKYYHDYYDYRYYWGYPGVWAMEAVPGALATGHAKGAQPKASEPRADDVHLRSAKELRGYRIEGSDGEIGHIADFIADDAAWAVRYLVINTSDWWLGKKVLVAPHWASRISWAEHKVQLGITRQTIQASPEWDAIAGMSRGYETRLHAHYGRAAYWEPWTVDVVTSPRRPHGQQGGHPG